MDDAVLTPLGLRCLIRSRDVVVTPGVRVLFVAVDFWPVTRLSAPSLRANEHADLLLLGSNEREFFAR
jgi:hypothetical protein